MGLYISLEDVKIRLVGKVRFTSSSEEENKMLDSLANKLISEAEAQVEQDLSPRYAAPFQTEEGTAFKNLPDRPTKQIIKTLCELMAVVRVLETDFGSGTAIDGEKYIKNIEKRYKSILNDNILAKVKGAEDQKQWSFPPLPGLRKNWFNTEADDGYPGMVLVSSSSDGRGDYPFKQINSPGETFWSGILDD